MLLLFSLPDNNHAFGITGCQQALITVKADIQHSSTMSLQFVNDGLGGTFHIKEVDTHILTASHWKAKRRLITGDKKFPTPYMSHCSLLHIAIINHSCCQLHEVEQTAGTKVTTHKSAASPLQSVQGHMDIIPTQAPWRKDIRGQKMLRTGCELCCIWKLLLSWSVPSLSTTLSGKAARKDSKHSVLCTPSEVNLCSLDMITASLQACQCHIKTLTYRGAAC